MCNRAGQRSFGVRGGVRGQSSPTAGPKHDEAEAPPLKVAMVAVALGMVLGALIAPDASPAETSARSAISGK